MGANESTQKIGSLRDDFIRPPESARAKSWWHWMNGNVSREGITLDLEAMHRAGIGGVQLFQVGEGIPEGRVPYGSAENLELLEYAANEAGRLGMEFGMMNSPGFSSSGGPWITPELSMQQLTWSESFVDGGKELRLQLPEPYRKHDYYQDAMVLAFPSLEGEERPLTDLLRRVTSSSGMVEAGLIVDGNPSKGVDVKPGAAGESAYLQLEFVEPYSARSVTIYGNAGRVTLESSNDGLRFEKVCELEVLPYGPIEVPGVANFSRTRARHFRLIAAHQFRISEFRLSGAERIVDWPQKANFRHRDGEDPLPATGQVSVGSIIDPATVLDISQHMDRSGKLRWHAPAGHWTILRIGHTTTGSENAPAPDGGLGLECDKYSRAAYEYHFNRFFGDMFSTLRTISSKVPVTSVIDSYEVGMQTWTKNYPQEFIRRRARFDIHAF